MEYPADILGFINKNFEPDQVTDVLSLLARAVLHDGKAPGHRVLRCALFAGRSDMEKLAYQINLISIDYRDVIVAGEYELREGDLVRVRDLSIHFPLDN